MRQFDLHRLPDGGLVINCQAHVLQAMTTRFVVPLLPPGLVEVTPGLNPSFAVAGESLHLYPQGAATVPITELGPSIGSLADHRYVILNALDVLITGI